MVQTNSPPPPYTPPHKTNFYELHQFLCSDILISYSKSVQIIAQEILFAIAHMVYRPVLSHIVCISTVLLALAS